MPNKMTITDELLLIKEKHKGILYPAHVVEYARNPKTALHNRFEWDDDVAAEKYRLWQARQIISLELVVINSQPESPAEIVTQLTEDNCKQTKVRAFVSLTTDRYGNQGYRTMEDVLSDDVLRAQLLEDAKADMITFKKKYKTLTELNKIIEAMDCFLFAE